MVLTGQGDGEGHEKVIDMWEYLPLVFILACPLMMIFMMGGTHGGPGSSQPNTSGDSGLNQVTDQATQSRIAELERQLQTLRDQLTEQAKKP